MPLMFAYSINRFSHDVAHLIVKLASGTKDFNLFHSFKVAHNDQHLNFQHDILIVVDKHTGV